MSTAVQAEVTLPPLEAAEEALERARDVARSVGLAYAGQINPVDAWRLVTSGRAVLVDVRSAEELHFVGRVPRSTHVPWATGIQLRLNPDFVEQLRAKVDPNRTLLLLCRSAKRSASAAAAATAAGFTSVFNIEEGFEGEIDDDSRRGHINGWRLRGLPWVQT
jgi:rhodanese-related sulfurtransferase